MFKKATKAKSKARILLSGASGSGKTTAALTIASQLGKRIAVIDTESGSASLYSDKFNFDVLELGPPYSPERFIEGVEAAEQAGYEVIVIDSITHEWSGPGGVLDIKTKMGDRFQDWAKVTPRHEAFVQALLRSKAHIVATVRSKQGYAIDEKNRPKKVGLEPQQRDGLDYEFTLVFAINESHMAEATKDRTGIFDSKPEIISSATGKRLVDWLNSGADPVSQEQQAKDSIICLIDEIIEHPRADLVPELLGKLKLQTIDQCNQKQLERIKAYIDDRKEDAQ
jgi:hypothetical protein